MLKAQKATEIIQTSFDAAREVHQQWRNLYDFANGVDGEFDNFSDLSTGQPGKYNIIGGLVGQICNPIEETPPEITIIPGDGATKDDAASISGYMRTLHNNCDAGHIYATAFRDMVKAGIGCWMYRTVSSDDPASDDLFPGIDDHEDEAGETKNEIIVEPLFPEQVAWDPSSKKPNKRDARWCVLDLRQNRDDFFRSFPKAKAVKYTQAEFDISTSEEEDCEFHEIWYRNNDARRIERYVVYQETIVFEDFTYKGAAIPVIWMESPVCFTKDHKRILLPLSHMLIDLQAEINYWHTTATDMIARAPKHTWEAEDGAIGVEELPKYGSAATDPDVVLFHAPGKKPELNPPPEIPECYLRSQEANIQLARDITGLYPNATDYAQKGIDAPSGESQRQQRAMSGLAGAQFVAIYKSTLLWAGKVLFNLVRTYHNDDSIRMSTGADGAVRSVSFGPTKVGTEEQGIINIDLEAARYGIVIQTGANYATQKQELIDRLAELASKSTDLFHLLAPFLVAQWSVPGTEELEGLLKVALWPPQVQQYMADIQTNDPRELVQKLILKLNLGEQEKQQLTRVLEATTNELSALKDAHLEAQQKSQGDLQKQALADQGKLQVESARQDAETQRHALSVASEHEHGQMDLHQSETQQAATAALALQIQEMKDQAARDLQAQKDAAAAQLEEQRQQFALILEEMKTFREMHDTNEEQRLPG